MAHHEVWGEAQILVGEHRRRLFQLPPPYFSPQSFPPKYGVDVLNPTKERVSTTAVFTEEVAQTSCQSVSRAVPSIDVGVGIDQIRGFYISDIATGSAKAWGLKMQMQMQMQEQMQMQ